MHEKDLFYRSLKEWAYLKADLPASNVPDSLRALSLRDIFDAIFYALKSGCPWRLLPRIFPPWSVSIKFKSKLYERRTTMRPSTHTVTRRSNVERAGEPAAR